MSNTIPQYFIRIFNLIFLARRKNFQLALISGLLFFGSFAILSTTSYSKKFNYFDDLILKIYDYNYLTNNYNIDYLAKNDRALKLLNYLRLDNDSKTLSLLTFTSLITLINELIPGKIEDNVNLDLAIRICRDWLENPDLTQYMDEDIKLELKKIVVTKGMIVNGIDVNESDEE